MSKICGHVLLGGGTGFIGSALGHLLKKKGYEITVISRMPGPQRVSWVDVESNGLPDGVTAVVNLAGQNILDPLQRWTPGFKQNVWNSRVNTTATLARAIQQAQKKPDVFVTVSGVGVYNPASDKIYDEDSDVGDSFDFLSKLALEMEKTAILPKELNVRNAIIRSGVVIGRSGGMVGQMFLPFYLGLGGPLASGQQVLPWIHLKDICSLFLFAIENSHVQGILNGVAPQIITNEQFTKEFASALGRPAIFRVPEFVLNLMFSEERAKIMTQGQKVHPKRVLELGFKYDYPEISTAAKSVSSLFYNQSELF